MTCFEKNAEFAHCAKTCVKGIHAEDEPPWRTAWSCKVLKPGLAAEKTTEIAGEKVSKPATESSAKDSKDAKDEKKSKCGDVFQKCGGKGYKGETCCLPGCKCKKF